MKKTARAWALPRCLGSLGGNKSAQRSIFVLMTCHSDVIVAVVVVVVVVIVVWRRWHRWHRWRRRRRHSFLPWLG